MIPVTIGSTEIRSNDAGLISLNDLHQAAQALGYTEGKRDPRRWKEEAGKDFIDVVAGTLNVRTADIMKTTRGKGGGTYAHWQIALAYAKYLSPALHMQVNEVYARAKSGDVTLADEIADKASPKQQEWLAKRLQGKIARNQLTTTLAQHGVVGRGYVDCTNALYRPLMGGTKKEVCEINGIDPKKNNLRNLMTLEQVMALSMAELVAKKQIEKFNVQGNSRCAGECDKAARSVSALLC